MLQLAVVCLQQIDRLLTIFRKKNLTTGVLCRRLGQQLEHRKGSNRFTRAAFANDGYNFPALNGEVEVVNGLCKTVFTTKTNIEIAHLQQG